MGVYDLADRLNWQQACEVLGCSKSLIYRLVKEGNIPMYGVGKLFRWFSRADCEKLLHGNNSVSREPVPAEKQNERERE